MASPTDTKTAANAAAAAIPGPGLNKSLPVSQRLKLLMAKMTLADKINMVTGAGTSEPYVFYISAIPSLCIPATMTVHYTDGSATSTTLNMADWYANAPAVGNQLRRRMRELRINVIPRPPLPAANRGPVPPGASIPLPVPH